MSPLLGFQERFADAVASGEKRQTIRAFRKDGRDPKRGDTLHLWTGLRRPGARKLGEVTCTAVLKITICADREVICPSGGFHATYGPYPECNRAFARADGFRSYPELVDWFEATHGLPFSGLVIRW